VACGRLTPWISTSSKAGKSTVFNCIAGVFPPSDGEIHFSGRRVNNMKPWDLCKQGLARTFQIVKPFASKTLLYNVMVGSYAMTDKRSVAESKALGVLKILNLYDKRDMRAGNLTIGDRKRLEIARALATEPKLLLLDEVMAGLRPTEVDEMVKITVQRSSSSNTSCGLSWPSLTGSSSFSSDIRFLKGPQRKLPRMKK
jgi:branched-chain amino acid transport system ATP-binding protein